MDPSRRDQPEDGEGRGDVLWLVGRIVWRLVQAAALVGVIVLAIRLVNYRFNGDTREKAYMTAMRADLRNLVSAQEAYYADYQGFAPSLAVLGPSFYKPGAGLTVVIDQVAAAGFSASVTSAWIPSYRCAVFIGSVQPVRPDAVEGQPKCWKP